MSEENNKKSWQVTPFTLKMMQEEARERVSIINKEFKDGFDFLSKYPCSVTVFGSSNFSEDNHYYQKAREFGNKIVTEAGFAVITGGGPGIMEAANRGAYEAKGDSIGFCIDLPREQETNPYVTDHLDFHYFFSRKVSLSFSAEAFVYFPGGFGTLDEFFEIVTLVQTNKLHRIPIFLYGEEYWKPLDEFFHASLVSKGTINEEDKDLYKITDDLDYIVETIKNDAQVIAGVRRRKE